MKSILSLLFVLLVTLAAPSPAAADAPRTARSVQIGAGFRYGVSLSTEGEELDPWRTGLGLELGYTTLEGIYLGGVFDYFFGERRLLLGTEFKANVWQLAAEGGYDFQLSDGVLVRPKLGLGVANLNVSCSDCIVADESSSDFALAPGLTAMFFPGSLILSFDTRYQMVFADERYDALIFSFGIGF